MTGFPVFCVEEACIGGLEAVHDLREGPGRTLLQQQVDVIAHQTIGVKPKLPFLKRFPKVFQVSDIIPGLKEHFLSVIAARDHMVKRARVFQS